MSEAPVILDVAEGVARIRLNRPGVANAIDLPLAVELERAVERCAAVDVAVVLITGAGARFCAGGDITDFLTGTDPSAALLELAQSLDRSTRILGGLAKPVVCAVQGAVAGAGLGLVLAADFVVAERHTKFATAFTGVGLTPDSGVSYLLPQVVGLRRALELTLTGRVITADEAADWGLISSVVDGNNELEAAAESMVSAFATGPSGSLGESRRLLRAAFGSSRKAHGADEARTIAAALATAQARELIERFTARRATS